MSHKCRAFSTSKIGLQPPNNRNAFYAGWEAMKKAFADKPPPKVRCEKHGVHGLSLLVGGERYCGLCFKELLGEPVKVVE
jgi:hypothetical protein